MMKTQILGIRKTMLAVLFFANLTCGTAAQWQIGEQVLSSPAFGNYYSMRRGSASPPLPFLPYDVPVYYLGTIPGTTNDAFAYDDRNVSPAERPTTQTTENGPPPVPGDGHGGSSGGETNTPMGTPFDYGTNLYLLIGPTNVPSGSTTNREAWLILTNTHNPKFYQIESRPRVVGAPWELGQIVQDTGSTHQVRFRNVRTDDPSQRFFRGVGGDTVAFITLEPDYNFAVESPSANGTAQTGKFRVTLDPAPSSSVTVVYQVSGSASNGVDYTTRGGTVTVGSSPGFSTIDITPLYDTLPEFDESVTLTLVLTNGYLVEPTRASATMKLYDPRPENMAVAIHDSGWTRWFGLSTTNWNYFVLPESLKEALRSDGTPYAVLSDLDIANGVLLTTNGKPRYPILISLAAEVIRDDEIAPLANYVTNGGFVLAGSSSFTRNTDGSFRTNFALASQMGLGCSPSALNWYDNTNFTKQVSHPLLRDIPDGTLVWRMPASPEETSWGTCLTHSLYCNGRGFDGPHPIWWVTNSSAQVLAVEDGSYPYVAVKGYGSGYFVYDAALQPLIGHGGFAPGMYAYMIFRRAIEWAFESAERPVVKLSPWPYQYDAAFMIRHDLEDYANEISDVAASAAVEFANGARGDYYFCTGRITNEANYASIVSGLQTAVGSYGATIGPHNGGLPNPRATSDLSSCCYMDIGTYEYWHWGPDEGLDLLGGRDYVSNSLAISFSQIEAWLPSQTNSPRVWVAPYFNATREDSYEIQEGLNVKITGDQKLTPFPAFTLSPRKDGKRYDLLSEPTSDWFVGGSMAQSLDPWHAPGIHTTDTMHAGVDFYYTNGFLINFYAHGLSTGDNGPRPYPYTAGYLIPDYIQYCMNAQRFPRLWSSNARGVYDWWLKRSTARITASYGTTNGTHSLATVNISGAQDADTAVEILASGFGTAAVALVRTNGVATTGNYRTAGELMKVQVGNTVTNVQVEYYPGPAARDDTFTATQGQALTVGAGAGVLSNDFSGTWFGLVAIANSLPEHGTFQWNANNDGGFIYTPSTTNFGTECFSYQATDGVNDFGTATVTIRCKKTNDVFSDNFTRCNGNSISPWQADYGPWTLGSGVIQGSLSGAYGYCHVSANSTNSSVEARINIASGSWAGGLGGRLNPTTGAHYAAWVYPENSPSPLGAKTLALVKFSSWTAWGYSGTNQIPMKQYSLTGTVSNAWHTLRLDFSGNHIDVYYDDISTPKISMDDTDTASAPLPSGSVSLDFYDGVILVDDVSITSP